MFDKKLEFIPDGNFVIIVIANGDTKREVYRVPRSAFTAANNSYNEQDKRG